MQSNPSPPPSYREEKGELHHQVLQNQVNQNVYQSQVHQVPPQQVIWANQNQVHPSGMGCPQILYTCSPPIKNDYKNYKGTQSMVNGFFQILLGLLCIGFNAALIQVGIGQHYRLLEVVSYGIWGGAIFIVTGAFGIAAGKVKNKCLIVAFMVLSIISCTVSVVVLSMSIVNVMYAADDRYELITALNGVLLTLSVIEGAFGIWASVNCCAAVCCGASQQQVYLTSNPVQYNQGNTRIIVVDNMQALNPSMLQNMQQGYPTAPTATTF